MCLLVVFVFKIQHLFCLLNFKSLVVPFQTLSKLFDAYALANSKKYNVQTCVKKIKSLWHAAFSLSMKYSLRSNFTKKKKSKSLCLLLDTRIQQAQYGLGYADWSLEMLCWTIKQSENDICKTKFCHITSYAAKVLEILEI